MRDDEWRELDDESLERMLVERWLYRGMTLAVILLAAVAATYLGTQGVATLMEHVTVGALVALALAAGALGFAMRQEDLRIHRELRRRRQSSPPRRHP
jgi:FtsH-binding integral membrane protein